MATNAHGRLLVEELDPAPVGPYSLPSYSSVSESYSAMWAVGLSCFFGHCGSPDQCPDCPQSWHRVSFLSFASLVLRSSSDSPPFLMPNLPLPLPFGA